MTGWPLIWTIAGVGIVALNIGFVAGCAWASRKRV